jgi:O-antigen ligase
VTLLETRSTRVRAGLAVLLLGAGICFFLTYTRSAWIGFAAALLILGIFRYRWMITFGSVALLAAALAFPGAVNTVQGRFNNPGSLTWRTGEWNAILPYGFHHPLIGTGFGSYQADTVREFGYENPRYPTLVLPNPATAQKGFTAHNDYVRMLVELGYPGLVLWSLVLLFLLGSLIRAARSPAVRPLAVGLAAVMAGLIVVSYADNVQAYTIDLLYPLVLAGGLATVSRREGEARRDVGRLTV